MEGRRGEGKEGWRGAQQASENHDLTKEKVQTVPPQLGPKLTFGSCTMTLVEGRAMRVVCIFFLRSSTVSPAAK